MNETNSFAGYAHAPDDAVHDYERKAPLREADVHRMFRIQPADPQIAKDHRPEDTFKLMDALEEGTTCIIPTCDITVTLEYMKFRGYNVKMSILNAEDQG